MYYYNSKDLIDCAIIKVDSTSNDGYNYNVRIKDIEETMNFIKNLYEEIGLPCNRIYLSGFACLGESYIWTKQKITNHAINEANRIKLFAQENMKALKK